MKSTSACVVINLAQQLYHLHAYSKKKNKTRQEIQNQNGAAIYIKHLFI